MSTVENLFGQYNASWKNQPDGRVVAEAASIYLETNHLPESYGFGVNANGLIDTISGKPVKSVIARNTPTEILEGIAFDKIENWAVEYGFRQKVNNISSIWISPPDDSRSKDTKFIISTIQINWLGIVKLYNCAFLVSGETDQCIDVANNIITQMNLFSPQFTDLNNLRSTPFLFKREIDMSKIVEIIEKGFADKNAVEVIKQGKVDAVTQQALNLGSDYVRKTRYGKTISQKSNEAMSSSSEYEPSCPPAFSETQSSSASEVMMKDGLKYKFVKNCGGKTWWGEACNARIGKFITKGYRCPHCFGIYKGC